MSNFDLGPSKFDELLAKDAEEPVFPDAFSELGLDVDENMSPYDIDEKEISPKVSRRRIRQRGGGSGDSGVSGSGEVDPLDDGEHTQSEPVEDDEEEFIDDTEDDDDYDFEGVDAAQIAAEEAAQAQALAEAEFVEHEAQKAAQSSKRKETIPEDTPEEDSAPNVVVPEKFNFARSAYNMVGQDKLIGIKGLPIELIDRLRDIIRPYGNGFAEGLSAKSLVSAFIVAHTGMQVSFDADTQSAVSAFKQAQPALEAVESRIDSLTSDIMKIRSSLKRLHGTADAIHSDTAASLFINSWGMADRFAMVPDAVGGALVDFDHPEVGKVLDHASDAAKERVTDFKREKGRPFQ